MTPKIQTLEGKNRTEVGKGGQKLSKIVRHHLWMIPKVGMIYKVGKKPFMQSTQIQMKVHLKNQILNFINFSKESQNYVFWTQMKTNYFFAAS